MNIKPKEVIFYDNEVDFIINGFEFTGKITETTDGNIIFEPCIELISKEAQMFHGLHWELINDELGYYYFHQSNF